MKTIDQLKAELAAAQAELTSAKAKEFAAYRALQAAIGVTRLPVRKTRVVIDSATGRVVKVEA